MSFRMGQTKVRLRKLHDITDDKLRCPGMEEKEKRKVKANLRQRMHLTSMMRRLDRWSDIENEVEEWHESTRRGYPYDIRAKPPEVRAAIAEVRASGDIEGRRARRNVARLQPEQLAARVNNLNINPVGRRVPPPRPPPPRPPPPRTRRSVSRNVNGRQTSSN